MSAQLQHFFQACDPEGTRSVDREAFRDLCSRLNIATDDADVIFEDLDHDRDGRISFSDFSRGFSNFISTADVYEATAMRERQMAENAAASAADSDEATKHHVWTTLTSEAERVGRRSSDEGKLRWLLNELQMSEQRHLVPYLEVAVEELLANLHQLQEEKARLEDTWKREKSEHEKHLKRMEEELDNQVKEAELKMRLKAQEEVEDERKTLQTRMDTELDKLQTHLLLMEKVYSWLRTQPSDQRDVRLDEVRSKLDEAVHENRQLRMSLLDTQTSIALMRGELLQLRTMYEDKCRELSSERERILEVLQEQDHLSRQLNLLHDANKRLLDSHDVLRNNAEVPAKTGHTKLFRCKSGSVIGDYLDSAPPSYDVIDRFDEDDDLEDNDSMISRRPKSMDCTYTYPVKRRSKPKDRQIGHLSLNQSDSGVSSSVRDSGEVEEAWGDSSPRLTVALVDSEDDYEEVDLSRNRLSRRDSGHGGPRPSSMPPPHDRQVAIYDGYSPTVDSHELRPSNSHESVDTLPRRKISDIKKQLGIEESESSYNWTKCSKPLQCSTPKERQRTNDVGYGCVPTPMPRASKVSSIYESIDNDSVSDAGASEYNNNSVEEDELFEPTGPPETTFKIIFVGDAGVGKSSFALRISKGVFVRHMSSTLGLDFLNRNFRVDGKNLAVQLWDTAGQERFRSITKTYFRKADGVMLLYDCTCEQSFLNVRQWVEDIDVSCFYSMMADKPVQETKTNQRIPLMIVANKVDLRPVALKTGTPCVSTKEGQKLAKDCDTLFMEASAKDGANVLPALASLVRLMVERHDLQASGSTMQLSEAKPKKSCCGK